MNPPEDEKTDTEVANNAENPETDEQIENDSILSESLLADEMAAEAEELLESVTSKDDETKVEESKDLSAEEQVEKEKTEVDSDAKDNEPETETESKDDKKNEDEKTDEESKPAEVDEVVTSEKSADESVKEPEDVEMADVEPKNPETESVSVDKPEEKSETPSEEPQSNTMVDLDRENPESDNANLDEEGLLECEAPKPREPVEEESKDECEESSSSDAEENQQEIEDDIDEEKERELLEEPEEEAKELNSNPETPDIAFSEDSSDKPKVDEAMEVDEKLEITDEKPEIKSEDTKEDIKDILKDLPEVSKLNFLRKFASVKGKLSRDELEEIITAKIVEVFLFTSENAKLRSRIEKQEILLDTMKSRVDNLKKQYSDLEMIHTRIMKDLKERSNTAITPVKITRAVGLQVFQPAANSLNIRGISQPVPPLKRKTPEAETNEIKRKKMTPMRAPLSATQSQQIEKANAIEEQKLKQNMSRMITPTVSLTARKSTSAPGSSIDLTSEDVAGQVQLGQLKKFTLVKKIPGNFAGYQTPALVALNPTGTRAILHKAGTGPGFISGFKARPNFIPPMMQNALTPHKPKRLPSQPEVTISKDNQKQGIVVSWNISDYSPGTFAEIKSYEIYAYEDNNAPPALTNWRKVGDVKALLLPMAVTLTQFNKGELIRDCTKKLQYQND